jgi:hypothetical protein
VPVAADGDALGEEAGNGEVVAAVPAPVARLLQAPSATAAATTRRPARRLRGGDVTGSVSAAEPPGRPPGDTGQVLGLDLALSLRAAGLRWTPRPGDRFVLPHRGMDEDVFVLSDMTVEVHRFPTGSVIGFNGVTEWALDSVDQHEAVWLPAEHQLREMLGGLFVRLESGADGFEVTLSLPSGRTTHRASTAEDAYGRALLAVLREVTGSFAEPTVR